MDWLLLSIGVVGAVALLFKYALAPAKDGALRGERMKKSAVLGRLFMLGKKCRTVCFGLGVDHRAVKLSRAVKQVENSELGSDAVFKIVTDNADFFARAEAYGKAAMRRHNVPHVGRFPRVYLLCREMTVCTRGDIADICINGVRVFEKNAPLDSKERKLFKGVLVYCLCALLYGEIGAELKRCARFTKGASDGKKGKIDLDGIGDGDYVCGLLAESDTAARADVLRVLADNGVNARAAVTARNVRVCAFYATVCAVVRSLEFCGTLVAEESESPRKRVRKSAEIALAVSGGIAIAVGAVLAAVMLSPRYVGVFCVLAVIVYGVTRFPVLMFADGVPLDAPERADTRPVTAAPAAALTEAAYFGCEPTYHSYTVCSSRVGLRGDNRGTLKLLTVCNGVRREIPIGICFLTGDGEYPLKMFDGAFEKHKITFRAVSPSADFFVEATPSCDSACCIIKLTVVNRTDETISASLSVMLGECGVFAAVGFEGESIDGQLCAQKTMDIPPFDRRSAYCSVALGTDGAEAERLMSYSASKAAFDFAADCMRAYCFDGDLPVTGTETLDRVIAPPKTRYWKSPELAARNYVLGGRGCGYDADGAFICDGGHDFVNALCDGAATLGSVGADGIKYLCGDIPLDCVCRLGEGEAIWSPFTDIDEAEHGLGYSRLIRAYNGCTVRTCAVAFDGALLLDIGIENAENADRTLDVLFAVDVRGLGALAGDGVYSFGTESAVIICSHKLAEKTAYKEGFYSYGKIDRARGLGAEGSTIFPAFSVPIVLAPRATERVTIAVTDVHRVKRLSGKLNEAVFDVALKKVVSRAHSLSPIELKSGNPALDIFYQRAIYDAYCSLGTDAADGVGDRCLKLAAAKYADRSAAERGIISLLSAQRADGCLGGDAWCGLYAAALVLDHVDFCGDNALLREVCPFSCADGAIVFASVTEHCLLALDFCLPMLREADLSRACTPCALCAEKAALWLLHRFSDMDIGYARKALYTDALCKTAERYSRCATVFARGYAEFEDYSAKNVLLYSLAMFYIGNTDKAAKVLLGCNPLQRYIADGKLSRYSERECLDGAASALFYSLVTEKLIGAQFRGNMLKFCPEVDGRMSFTVRAGDKRIIVAVDGTGEGKQWIMRIGKINYGGATLDLTKTADGTQLTLSRPSAAQ